MSKLLFVLMSLTVFAVSFSAMANEKDPYGHAYEYEADHDYENLVQPKSSNVSWKVKYTITTAGDCGSGTTTKTCRKTWSDSRTVGGCFTKGESKICETVPYPRISVISHKMELLSYPASSSLPDCPSAADWTWHEPFLSSEN